MNRALQAFVVSCAAIGVAGRGVGVCRHARCSRLTRRSPVRRAASNTCASFPGNVVLSQMNHALLTGAFANGDYSTEYAIDDTLTLVKIDTATGVVTPLGALIGFSDCIAHQPHHRSRHRASPTRSSRARRARAPILYGVDLTNGATALIGMADGCMQSMVYASDGTHLRARPRQRQIS